MRVRYEAHALDQLASIRDWLIPRAGKEIAASIVRELFNRCDALNQFANRGTLHEEIRPGLRTIPHRRRFTIGYIVEDDTVIVLGVIGRGQQLGKLVPPPTGTHAATDDRGTA